MITIRQYLLARAKEFAERDRKPGVFIKISHLKERPECSAGGTQYPDPIALQVLTGREPAYRMRLP